MVTPFPVTVTGALSTDWIAVAAQISAVLLAGVIGYLSAIFLNNRTIREDKSAKRATVIALIRIELAELATHLQALVDEHPNNAFITSESIYGIESLWQVYLAFLRDFGALDPPQYKLLVETYSKAIALERQAKLSKTITKSQVSQILESALRSDKILS